MKPRKSLASVLSLGLGMLLLVGYLDHITGTEIGFSIFYLFPLTFVTWNSGRSYGLLMAALCAAAWMANDYWLGGTGYSHLAVPFWNGGIRAGYFVLACILLSRLKTAIDREKEASNLKSSLLAFVSHEFGGHLATLGLALHALKSDRSGGTKISVSFIYETMERTHNILKQTVNNILNATAIESGRFHPNIRRTELRALVGETLAAMNLLVHKKELDVRCDFPAEVIPLEADPDAMSLVMTNLIGNAIKYTPAKGSITIRLQFADDAKSEVIVSVEDTGIGVKKADQEKILSGYRTDEAQAVAKGFGVGLRLVVMILQAHKSRLLVGSDAGRGSRFYFRLPVLQEKAPAPSRGGESSSEILPAKKPRASRGGTETPPFFRAAPGAGGPAR